MLEINASYYPLEQRLKEELKIKRGEAAWVIVTEAFSPRDPWLWDPEGVHLRYLTTSIGPEGNQPPDSYAQFDLSALFSAWHLHQSGGIFRRFRV